MRKQILILLGFSFSLIACQQNEEIGSVEDNANPNELTTRAASMRRVPTQAEKDNLKKDFPNLDVNNISVTGEATGTYNCIAYSMGITNKWIDPESFYNDFIEQYKNAKTLYGSSCNYEQTSTEGMEVLYIVAVLGSQNLGVICVLPIKGVSYLALCMVEFWFLLSRVEQRLICRR